MTAPEPAARPAALAPSPADVAVPPEVLDAARTARRVAVLSGAGMSEESGVPTFRDAHTGLWERFDADELVTADAWLEDPDLVWGWHWWLARLVRRCEPNAGHRALAQWAAREAGGPGGLDALDIITQNVDDLHERGGSAVGAHLHGNLFTFSCGACGTAYPLDVPPLGEGEELPERITPPRCPLCDDAVRPDVVLFGEHLPQGAFDAGVEAMLAADLCLVVGTSGIVQPAGSLPDLARGHGAYVVEVNPHETTLSWGVDHCWRESAGRALPALVTAVVTTVR